MQFFIEKRAKEGTKVSVSYGGQKKETIRRAPKTQRTNERSEQKITGCMLIANFGRKISNR